MPKFISLNFVYRAFRIRRQSGSPVGIKTDKVEGNMEGLPRAQRTLCARDRTVCVFAVADMTAVKAEPASDLM
jgi:hypothetical protein